MNTFGYVIVWLWMQAPYLIYVEVVECDNMHVDAVPIRQMEGALRHSRSQDDLTSLPALSAERSPHAEPVTVNSCLVSVAGCEFDDADCWTQEDDDIIQVMDSSVCSARSWRGASVMYNEHRIKLPL